MFKILNRFKRSLVVASYQRKHGNCFDFYGVPVTIPIATDTSIQYALIRGKYERPEAEMIRRYVSQGCNVVELGGCLGVVSQLLRNRIGMSAKHVIVEADPGLAEHCRLLFKDTDNTEVISAAIAYGAEHVEFQHGKGNSHAGCVTVNSVLKDEAATLRVPAVTLSTLIGRLTAAESNVLICDIEGSEMQILEHDGDLLAKFFDVIVFEFHPEVFKAQGSSGARFFELCKSNGLEILQIAQNVAAFQTHRKAA